MVIDSLFSALSCYRGRHNEYLHSLFNVNSIQNNLAAKGPDCAEQHLWASVHQIPIEHALSQLICTPLPSCFCVTGRDMESGTAARQNYFPQRWHKVA